MQRRIDRIDKRIKIEYKEEKTKNQSGKTKALLNFMYQKQLVIDKIHCDAKGLYE